MKSPVLFTTLFASATAFGATKTEWNSAYTDLSKECIEFESATEKAPIDFYASDCKSFGGYRLQFSGGDIRYAPVLSFNGEDLEMGRPGAFHDRASDKVEWVYKITKDEEGQGEIEWKGFIYRLSVATDDGSGSHKILYAVRLNGTQSCFLGNPATNEAARALVKSDSAPCVNRE